MIETATIDEQEYFTVGVLHGTRGPYTYRVPVELEDQIEDGTVVVVKNARGYAVGEVFDIHSTPEDTDPGIDYKWVFQVVDVDAANELDPD